jgi:hypothetical protein
METSMGLGSFLKTLVNPNAMAEEIIRLQEIAYREGAKLYVGADPHVLLAHAWLSRMAARGQIDSTSPVAQQQAFHQTWQFALIPWPANTRALGLFLLREERPEITTAFPQYSKEFDALLTPGLQAMKDGSFFAKYEQMNPQMEYAPSKQTGTGWLFGPKTQASGGNKTASESADDVTVLGERIASTLSGYVSQAGTASLFDAATLVVLTKDNRVFISQASPDNLPFKAEVISYVAIKDLPAIDKCKELMGDGSHSGAMFLAVDLLTRAILGAFEFRAN